MNNNEIKKIGITSIFIFSFVFSFAQKYNLELKTNIGYTNAFYYPKIKNYSGNIGYSFGGDFSFVLPKVEIGFGVSYKQISYFRVNNVERKINYLTFPVFITKRKNFFSMNLGFLNNFSLNKNKVPQELIRLNHNPEVFYTFSVFAEPTIKITKNISVSTCLFSDLSPSTKNYAVSSDGYYLISVEHSYGIMFGVNYKIK